MLPKSAKCCFMAKQAFRCEGDFAGYDNNTGIRRVYNTMWLLFLLHSFLLAVCFASQTTTSCPESCECLKESVKCAHKSLTTIPANVPKSVTNLDLSGNNISFIEKNGFLQFPKLIQLNLDYNNIKDVTLLGILPQSLQHMSLKENKLTSLADLNTNSLKTLDISGNNIMQLDEMSFQNCQGLKELNLGSNKISNITDKAFSKLSHLEILKLNNNNLQKIPKFEVKSLKTLDLSNNNLDKLLYMAFPNMPSLQILILSNNKIKSITTAAFRTLQLKKLYLDNNMLSSVAGDWLFGLYQLLHLYLQHNNISNISPKSWNSPTCCGKLKIIDLSYNKLQRVLLEKSSGGGARFRELSNLVQLNLRSNDIFQIADGAFRSLQRLKVLDLSGNRLSWSSYDSNGTFEGLTNLKKLNLGKNEITSIVKVMFEKTPNLVKLDITNNPVDEVTDESFSPLKNLRDLRMNTVSLFCGCKIQWFLEWLKNNRFPRLSVLKCGAPKKLEHREFSNMKVKDLVCDFSRPEITEHPQSKISLKGDDVQLSCMVRNGSIEGIDIIWKKDTLNISLSHSRIETAVQETDGKYRHFKSVLHLFDVNRVRDGGSYQCIVRTTRGELKSRKAQLDVFVRPRFTSKPKDVVTTLNGHARFNCTATGEPKPKVYLNKNSDIYKLVKERRVSFEKNTFSIHNVTMDDVGLYWCFAKNRAGLINTTFNINIKGKPIALRPMLNKVVLLQDSVMFSCATTGWPSPQYIWLKDGSPVNMSSSNIKHRREYNADHLIIIKTRQSDAGRYTCLVSNRLGTTELTSILQVVEDFPRKGNRTTSGDSLTKTTLIAAIVFTASFTMVLTALVLVAILHFRRRCACMLCPSSKKKENAEMDIYGLDYMGETTPEESPCSSTTFVTLQTRSDSNFLQTTSPASDSGSNKEENREGSYDGRQSSGVCSMNSSTCSLESTPSNHRNTFPFTNNTKSYPAMNFNYETSDDNRSCTNDNHCNTECCTIAGKQPSHRQSLLTKCTEHKPPARRKTPRTRGRHIDKDHNGCRTTCDKSRGDFTLSEQDVNQRGIV